MKSDDLVQVTLMFTDIEGSTRFLGSHGDDDYRRVQATISALLRPVFIEHHGNVQESRGDSLFVAFERSPQDALAAAIAAQRALVRQQWPNGVSIRVRTGLHTGRLRKPSISGETFVGLDVHRAARLCEAGHGGQVLVSETTQRALGPLGSCAASLRLLGRYHLRDLPNPEAIYEVVHPELSANFPPLRAVDVRNFNLPVPRTPLLGREEDIAELVARLSQPGSGVMTLCGPGGAGKTRLAVAVAARASGLFSDGLCFVPLAPVGDLDLVAPTIVRTLGLQEAGSMSLEEILFGHLRNRQLLLVLDNFEHVTGAAPLVADLLSNCPGVKVLATSRAPLRIRDEVEYGVKPLGVPDLSCLPSYEQFGRFPAIALFAERATAAASRFAITAGNFASVAAICARLDGLPLAIELAAARASVLTPQQILARFQHDGRHSSLDLLTNGSRDLPDRHRSLRDAIAWSYGLLDPTAQRLFRLLAVFVGGFTLDAAAAVTSGTESDDHRAVAPNTASSAANPELLDAIGNLAEHSLLQRVERFDGEARFALLETIREFGLEQLEAAGGLVQARASHAKYFLALAEEGEKQVGGPRQAEWLALLDEEQANFRSALDWSLSAPGESRSLGSRLAGALWVFWFRRAYLREGSRWVQQAYAVCPPDCLALRAKLLTADGSLARMLGDFARADTLLERAGTLWRQIGDKEGLAWALSHQGLVKQWLGKIDRGVELLEESLTLRLQSGDDRAIARSLFNLAVAEDFRCNYDRAAHLYERTLVVQRKIGDIWGIGRVSGYLAKVVLQHSGDHVRAADLCKEALEYSKKVADNWGVGLAQAISGAVAWRRGDLEQATASLKESLLTFRDVGSHDRLAECFQDLASLSRQLGAAEQAVRLSASAETIQEGSRLAFWPAVQRRRDAEIAAARAALGDLGFERAWTRGRSSSLEAAVEDALSVPDTHT